MKNNVFKYILFIFIIILSIFIISIISKQGENKQGKYQSTDKKEEKVEQTLNLGIAEFDTMNPILSNNKYVQSIAKTIYEPLLTINNNYELENCLVSEWAKTSETTYVIKIKENINWSNGEKVTTEDILFTIDRLKDSNIYNTLNIIRAEIVDSMTIKIILQKEVPFFEYNLNFPIMRKKDYEVENFKNNISAQKPIGTGKYTISDIKDNQIILTKNKNYWNIENEDSQLQTIKINLYETVGDMYNDFKQGNIDLLNTNNIDLEEYIGTIGYNKVESIGREYEYLAFNMKNDILSNIEVRQAISCAINKNEIISSIYKGKYISSDFPITSTNWLYQGNKEEKYNIEKAKQILLDNGWEFKYNYWQKHINYYTRKINFKLVVNSSNSERVKVAEMIKKQLETVGIKITIIKANDYTYNNYKTRKNYDMILCGTYIGTSPDLTRYFGDGNIANFQNEEAKTIVNDLKNITDKEMQKEKYKKLYEIYTNEIPYISLFNNYDITVYNKNLVGAISANWYNMFYNISNWNKK